MHNRNNILDEKGLFTFYLEQQTEQQNLNTQRQLKKMRQTQQEEPDSPSRLPRTLKVLKKQRQSIESPQEQKKAHLSQEKSQLSNRILSHSKERLRASIIQMGKDTNFSQPQIIHKPTLNPIRFRQHFIISKIAYVNGKDNGVHASNSQQNGLYYPQHTIEQFNKHSFQRHKMTQKVSSTSIKDSNQPQSSRDFVIELPQIKKVEEVKISARPKKSVKSKLIQEALHTGDRVKIKQIREYLRGQSPIKSMQSSELMKNQEEKTSRSMKIFQFRHQKLLDILQRFK